MSKVNKTQSTKTSCPALSPEAREQQLINLATNLAEQQLREGTASSQVITHFLKMASIKNQFELEKLKKENALLDAKREQINALSKNGEMYEAAMQAFKTYSMISDDGDSCEAPHEQDL